MNNSWYEERPENRKCVGFPGFPTAHCSPFVCWCLLVLSAARLSADGGFFEYRQELAQWRAIAEKQQTCFINYSGGYEDMLLGVKLDSFHSTRAAWVFPLPATPENVAIDVVPELPEFNGTSVRYLARAAISRALSIMAMSQLYPLAFMRGFPSVSTSDYEYGSAGGGGVIADGDVRGIEVHEHIEKLGLTTELITARDRDAPFAYLKEKGLELPDEARGILGDYVGKDYSLVVSWITDTARFQPDTEDEWPSERTIKQVALSIAFRTDSIYFPLKLTSIYANLRIPIVINLLGYVEPELYGGLKAFTTTECCVDEDYAAGPEAPAFFHGRDYFRQLRYTVIGINAPAKFLTRDLTIRTAPPPGVWFSDWLSRSIWLVGLLVFALVSVLASAIAAAIVFRADRPTKTVFTWLGLWNFLTLVSVVIAALVARSKSSGREFPTKPAADSVPSYSRRALYLLLFTLLFLTTVWLSAALLRALT